MAEETKPQKKAEGAKSAKAGKGKDAKASALVGEAGRVAAQQKPAVFGLGVVVPAEPVVAEGERGDKSQQRNSSRGKPVEPAAWQGGCRRGCAHA